MPGVSVAALLKEREKICGAAKNTKPAEPREAEDRDGRNGKRCLLYRDMPVESEDKERDQRTGMRF